MLGANTCISMLFISRCFKHPGSRALGATILTICLSSHLWVAMVPSEPWSQYVSMTYTFSHCRHSGIQMNHRSHYMNVNMYVKPFLTFFVPKWAAGTTILTTYRSSHLGHSRSLASPGSHFILHENIKPFQASYVPSEPWRPLYVKEMYT